MNIGSRVRLKSFNGDFSSPEECDSSENYWVIVGSTGTVSSSINSSGRVLVTFDIDVSSLGLYCHNEIPNSLLILRSDLEVLY